MPLSAIIQETGARARAISRPPANTFFFFFFFFIPREKMEEEEKNDVFCRRSSVTPIASHSRFSFSFTFKKKNFVGFYLFVKKKKKINPSTLHHLCAGIGSFIYMDKEGKEKKKNIFFVRWLKFQWPIFFSRPATKGNINKPSIKRVWFKNKARSFGQFKRRQKRERPTIKLRFNNKMCAWIIQVSNGNFERKKKSSACHAISWAQAFELKQNSTLLTVNFCERFKSARVSHSNV